MPKTLLLADDSVTIQKVVGITFANEDVELVTVDNGTDALAKARQILPHIVLADIGMPGMDGYELCAAIRRTPELAQIPVLLLTGTFESYDEARARAVGASGHISKPFEAQALVDRVWALLAEAEAAQGATIVADPLETPVAPASPSAADEDDELLLSLPELPNSSFGSTDPGLRAGASRLGPAQRADVPDLDATLGRTPAPPRRSELDPLLPARPEPTRRTRDRAPEIGEDPVNGETVFLDPLADLQDRTPPLGWAPPAASGTAPLLPPAEPPDFLDAPAFDPLGDTNPTYADGTSISGASGEGAGSPSPIDESVALALPDIPDIGALGADGRGPAQREDALPEVDPLDLEPLDVPGGAAPGPGDAAGGGSTVTSTLPPVPPQVPPQPPLAPAVGAACAPAAAPLDASALHGALEKLAWEAFGSLSQELVDQFTRRVEAILWEVVPALAERLVREEIERLKGDS